MAIKIKFDLVGNPEPPTIILANRNGNILGQLKVNSDTIELVDKLNAPEISFTINKYTNEELTPLWEKIVDFKLIYCKEWDAWFEIKVELDEETETVKTVFCTHLGEAELSQIMLYDIEINTEKDIERDDYKISILYDPDNPEASILHRILKDKAPHYTIAYVSPTIARIQRSFSFNGTSILDAHQEISEEIGCLFQYYAVKENGKLQRKIAVYDLQQYCNDCGHRGEYTDKCPKCGSTNITTGYGDDTLIFVTADELASEGIQLVTDTDSVKNCFKLEAGDDLMTATVRNCNPNGTDYIWYFSDSTKEDMSDELVDKIESYDELYRYQYNDSVSNIDTQMLANYNALVDKYSVYNKDLQKITTPITGYYNLMNALYNTVDLSLFLKSTLMPSVEISETNAKEQASFLTAPSLSPVAVADIDIVSLATANSAVLAMAKIVVKSTFKVEIKSSELTTSGSKKYWKGSFIVTNYSDEEDTAESNQISIELNDDLETVTKQKIDKLLNKENTDDLSITGLFAKEYNNFCAELKKYALNPLTSFHDACQACIDILIDQGVADKNGWSDNEAGSEGNLYEKLYLPYYNKLKAIEAEMKIREDEISIILGVYDTDGNLIIDGLQTNIEDCRNKIQASLDFKSYLGENLWLDLCAYRREDTYSNDNYISDGLNNAELFKKAQEFYEVAENEIYKSAELQHSISTTLKNLLAIEKFKPLVDSFSVGNWIRVQIDNEIYKLRLLEYNIDFGSFERIPVEFSDVTKVKNGITDVEDILSQASSMATSYDSIKRQADKGNDARGTIDEWLTAGLNSALVRIQNNNNEDITFDRNGLLGRSYDDITETYSPEQFRLTHNIMAYTTDNWETVSAALGKHEYTKWNNNQWVKDIDYGLSAKFVTAGYVTGSQIIGGEIVSSNYKSGKSGTYFDLINGDFEIAGGNIVYDTGDKALTLRNVTIEWANSTVPEITDISGLDEYLEQIDNLEDQLDSRAQTWYQSADPSSSWNTNELKALHVGDLWHYTGETGNVNGVKRIKNSEWVWREVNGVYQWVSIEISDEVFDTIDGKAQIFTSTPIPPYYVGDLWVQGSNGDILHCINDRESGSFVASDWKLSSKYTDDTLAKEALEKAKQGIVDAAKGISLAENAQSDIDNLQIGGRNLLLNTGDLKIGNYSFDASGADAIGNYSHNGEGGFNISCHNENVRWWLGSVAVTSGHNYVMSVRYKMNSGESPIQFQYVYRDSNNTAVAYRTSTATQQTKDEDGWIILSDVLTVPSDSNITNVRLAVRTGLDYALYTVNYEVCKPKFESGSKVTDWTPAPEDVDTKIFDTESALTKAYQNYADSKISTLDSYVAKYLGLGGNTIIGENYVISPIIEGGYLNVTNTDNKSRVIIDPNNLTGNNYIFQVHNGNKVTMGVDKNGNTTFNGAVTATSLTLGSDVTIGTKNISGLSKVATSGSYSDLSGKPTIPTSAADLGIDTSKIIYKGDIKQSTETDSNGITYLKTTVPTSSGGEITYSTYDAENYLVFGRSKGTDSSGNNYVCVSKDGLLTARNAVIYGTVYATDGEFTGRIKGGTININDKFIVGNNGDVDMQSGGKFAINSGGTVQISAGDSDNSFINFGEAFAVSKNGVFAENGTFASLKVNGQDVLTTDKLGYKIVVATEKPNETGIVWLKPTSSTSVKTVEYSGATPSSRKEASYLGNSNVARTFIVNCSTTDVLSGSGTFKYKVRFPIILAGDVSNQSNVGFNVTATKSDNSNLKVVFPTYTLATIEAWKWYYIEATVESDINLCETTSGISVSIQTKNAVNDGYLHVQKDNTIYLTCSNMNMSEGEQTCSVYYIP